MVATFACPECGAEVEVSGLTPGREVQCAFCETLVEIPYLPRAGEMRRRRFARTLGKRQRLGILAGGVVACLLLLLVGNRLIGSRVRAGREETLASLEESVDQALRSGRLDVALYETEAVLVEIARLEPENSTRRRNWKQKRDDLAKREAESRLTTIDALGPREALGASLTLDERARTDSALAGLTEPIQAAVDRSRLRLAQAELDSARKALDAGKPFQAFEAAEAQYQKADLLARGDRAEVKTVAEQVIRDAVQRHGVVPLQIQGRFTNGSIDGVRASLLASTSETLRSRGYLPTPVKSSWKNLWETLAPFELAVTIRESQTGYYLQSRNQTSQIEANWTLKRRGTKLWDSQITARTQVPLPNLPAYLASRIAVSDHRDPEVERRLYEDAYLQFLDQTASKLRTFPNWSAHSEH